jgi:hypothetical protein
MAVDDKKDFAGKAPNCHAKEPPYSFREEE